MAKAQAAGKRQPNAIVRFGRETAAELRKVNWPTRREATNLTSVVIIALVCMSILLGLLDFLFQQFFRLILSLA